MPIMSFANAINEALIEAMTIDQSVICYGLGVPDPKGVFGTTLGLQKKFGSDRVFDMPTSENGMTGIGIGAALYGLRPVITHQRLDFALLSLDQLVNNAAKWRYMFGGKRNVPITVRMILGRGWGQGPTHSQNLQAWFAHIPGLKVVTPFTPADAKGLLMSSIWDPDPVIFLEHRWLHNSNGDVPDGDFRIPLGKANFVRSGTDLTIVSMSYLTIEALHAADYLAIQGISCEIIDLRTIKPLDWDSIMSSVIKTGRLLTVDTGFTTGSVAGEVVARVAMEAFDHLKGPPARLAMPDVPEPTSPALTRGFYVRAADIAEKAMQMFGKEYSGVRNFLPEPAQHDVPGEWFKGPF